MEENELEMDKSGDLAALISFCVDSEEFKSNYQRNKFYRGLYGWKQKVTKGGKEYIYDRDGILDKVPHIKVDKSVYIVPPEALKTVSEYLDSWGGKIDYKVFKVLLSKDRFKKMNSKELEEEWTEIPVK